MSTSEFNSFASTLRLREKIRIFRSDIRHENRGTTADILRSGLGEICQNISQLENITEKDVHGLAARIKRRKRANDDDLFRLSHAFLQSFDNIATFMNIPGALNVLVKELTGSNARTQIMSCEALCNLSLGNEMHCEKLATAAGSYLVTHLDNSNARLQITSLWVLTNILATDGEGFIILHSQKIAKKLLHLYTTSHGTEIQNDVLIAISLLFDKIYKDERSSMADCLLSNFQTLESHNEVQLQVLFMILFQSDNFTNDKTQLFAVYSKSIKMAIQLLYHLENLDTDNRIQQVLYSVRIIANILAIYPESCNSIEEICSSMYQLEFVEIFNKIFGWNNKSVNTELMWLIKNLMSSQCALHGSSKVLASLRLSKLTIL